MKENENENDIEMAEVEIDRFQRSKHKFYPFWKVYRYRKAGH